MAVLKRSSSLNLRRGCLGGAMLAFVLFGATGCGGGGESGDTLAPKQQAYRLDFQFTIAEGSETPQAKTLARTLKEGSLITCWSEGPDRVCAAAVPNSGGGYSSISSDGVDAFTYYKATFVPGDEKPEVEEVEPEDALNPHEAKLMTELERERQKENEAAGTPSTVAACLRREGMSGVASKSIGAGGIYAYAVGGKGPSGAALGIVITKSPTVARNLGRRLSKQYKVLVSDDERDLLFLGIDNTNADRRIAEACLEPA